MFAPQSAVQGVAQPLDVNVDDSRKHTLIERRDHNLLQVHRALGAERLLDGLDDPELLLLRQTEPARNIETAS